MAVARVGAVAAPLPGGKVLVAGGYDAAGRPLRSAELYLPSGAFVPTGSMAVARVGAVAAPLPGGKVLVAGGYDAAGRPLRSAELYLPSGAFVPLDPVGCSRPAGLPAAAGASPGL